MSKPNKMQSVVEAALHAAESQHQSSYGRATVRLAYQMLATGNVPGYPGINVGREPLVYEKNVNGTRVARVLGEFSDTINRKRQRSYPDRTQHDMCLRQCFAIANVLKKSGATGATPPPQDDSEPQEQEQPKPPPPKADPTPKGEQAAMAWLDRVQNTIRPYVRQRGIAECSMRVVINGAKLYRTMGKSEQAFRAIEHAIAISWPEDSRRELGIRRFDPTTIKGEPQKWEMPKLDAGEHALAPACRMLQAAGNPVALVGPAGCGKSFLPAQMAENQGVAFGYVPMTAGASTTWLTGAFTLEGFITRPFVDVYEKGGIFLFDEMDAADPNMLLLVNNALANGEFQNPANGRTIQKHPEFQPFAAMNTMGTGANRRYVGRERLDMATLDRWATGMIEMDYDVELERRIFRSIIGA